MVMPLSEIPDEVCQVYSIWKNLPSDLRVHEVIRRILVKYLSLEDREYENVYVPITSHFSLELWGKFVPYSNLEDPDRSSALRTFWRHAVTIDVGNQIHRYKPEEFFRGTTADYIKGHSLYRNACLMILCISAMLPMIELLEITKDVERRRKKLLTQEKPERIIPNLQSTIARLKEMLDQVELSDLPLQEFLSSASDGSYFRARHSDNERKTHQGMEGSDNFTIKNFLDALGKRAVAKASEINYRAILRGSGADDSQRKHLARLMTTRYRRANGDYMDEFTASAVELLFEKFDYPAEKVKGLRRAQEFQHGTWSMTKKGRKMS